MSQQSSKIKRLVAALPSGTIPIGVGLFVNGLVTFVFLKLSAVAIEDSHERYLTTLWFLTFTLAPGLLLPLEQELGRAISARRHHGQGSLPVVQRAAVLASVLIGVAMTAALALGPLYMEAAFADSKAMLIIFAMSLPTYAAYYLFRGVLSGSHSFNSYGWLLAGEGILRIALCMVLMGLDLKHESYYAGTLVVAPLITLLIIAYRERKILEPGPQAQWSELTNALGLLILGQLLAQFLMNAAPLAVSYFTHNVSDPIVKASATHYSYGFLIARVPLYLFAAVQAALLPKLSRLVAAGRNADFNHGMKQLCLLIAGVTAIFTVGAGLLGPKVISTLYGPDYKLSHETFVLLGLACGAFMLATAFAQGLIAIAAYKDVVVSWLAGVIVFVALSGVGSDVQLRANLGFLGGSISAAGVAAILLHRNIRESKPNEIRIELERDDPELMVEP